MPQPRPKNKEIRQELHRSAKAKKEKQKLKRRLHLKSLPLQDRPINTPRTIESTAKPNPLAVGNQNQQEVVDILQTDEFSQYFSAAPDFEPKVLITTSKRATKRTVAFVELLADLIPNSDYIKRGTDHLMTQIIGGAVERGYTAIVLVSEAERHPAFFTLINLPAGPTAYFKLSSLVMPKAFEKRARSTEHYPELILNNFSSQLGLSVGRFFVSLFPKAPEFRGRQAITFHNQRDFIFVRRHRYQIREGGDAEGEQQGERVGLQEIGPRFCLKLMALQSGAYQRREGDYIWKEPSINERNKFYL